MFIIPCERLGITLDNKNIIYRPANMDDAPALCSLKAIDIIETMSDVQNRQIEAFWQENLANPFSQTYLAELKNSSRETFPEIGYFILAQEIRESSVFVVPNMRHRGISKGLLKSAGICCEPLTADISRLLENDQHVLTGV